MDKSYKIICCGLGVLGSEIVELIVSKKKTKMEIVGAVDVNPDLIGQDLGRAVGLDRDLGVKVERDLAGLCQRVEADVVLHTAEAVFSDIYKSAKIAFETGKNVISSGDQACFPWTKHPELAKEADELAKKKRVSFLGTGINPGFMMDFLPIALTGIQKRVDQIIIHRIADTSTCGLNYWNQLGYGRTREEFQEALKKGSVAGPMHMQEEIEMTARALNWGRIEYREEKEPMISEIRREPHSKVGLVEPGTVGGVRQTSRGLVDGQERITYIYETIIRPDLDGQEAGNYVTIKGSPEVVCSATGEQAKESWSTTAAMVVNSIPQVVAARPGLLAVYELPTSPCLA